MLTLKKKNSNPQPRLRTTHSYIISRYHVYEKFGFTATYHVVEDVSPLYLRLPSEGKWEVVVVGCWLLVVAAIHSVLFGTFDIR